MRRSTSRAAMLVALLVPAVSFARTRTPVAVLVGADVPQDWVWEVRAALRRTGRIDPRAVDSAPAPHENSTSEDDVLRATADAERAFRQASFDACVDGATSAERRLAPALAVAGSLRRLAPLVALAAACELKRGATAVALERATVVLDLEIAGEVDDGVHEPVGAGRRGGGAGRPRVRHRGERVDRPAIGSFERPVELGRFRGDRAVHDVQSAGPVDRQGAHSDTGGHRFDDLHVPRVLVPVSDAQLVAAVAFARRLGRVRHDALTVGRHDRCCPRDAGLAVDHVDVPAAVESAVGVPELRQGRVSLPEAGGIDDVATRETDGIDPVSIDVVEALLLDRLRAPGAVRGRLWNVATVAFVARIGGVSGVGGIGGIGILDCAAAARVENSSRS